MFEITQSSFGLVFNKEAAVELDRYASGRPLQPVLTNLIDDSFEGRCGVGWYVGCPVVDVTNLRFIFSGQGRRVANLQGLSCELHLDKNAQERLATFRTKIPGEKDGQILQARLEEWLSQELLPWSYVGCKLEAVAPILGR